MARNPQWAVALTIMHTDPISHIFTKKRLFLNGIGKETAVSYEGVRKGMTTEHDRSTVAAFRLLDSLPENPIMTVPLATNLLGIIAPPAREAIELLESVDTLHETTGKQRDRMYAYKEYLDILSSEA